MEKYRRDGNHLMISAKNIPEFYDLLTQAEKEAQQLNDTIGKLSRFEFDIEFSAESGSLAKTITTTKLAAAGPTAEKISEKAMTSNEIAEAIERRGLPFEYPD